MRIEIRGVIVPSYYDSDWTQEYIEKGLIIPESTFRRMLAKSPKDQPLQVYVNSPGGSVFAAYEMINAVREWKAATGQKAEVTIGAMAASAASAFAVMAGSSIKAHRNAKMMFHGASADMSGGKEAMEDTAELLGKINADIQNTLIQKYNMSPDTVAAWFAEGRQGWLNADEMAQAGIVSEVITDDADPVVIDNEAAAAIEDQGGLKIAAMLEITSEESTDDGDTTGEDREDDAAEVPADEAVTADTASNTIVVEPSEDYKQGVIDGIAQGRSQLALEYDERIATYERDLNAARDDARKHQSERDKLAARVKQVEADSEARATALRAQLEEATARIRKHIDGAMSFQPEPLTWEQAVEDCGGYAQAKARYPELCAKFKNEKGVK